MDDQIWTVENVIPDFLCGELRAFIDRYQKYCERSHYGRGENTNCRNLTIVEEMPHSDGEFLRNKDLILDKIKELLSGLVNDVVVPAIRPLSAPVFSPIQLRKMFGPTRCHFDNVSPAVIGEGQNARIATRIVTMILTISESTDSLVFPKQNRIVPLKKGSAVLFPPYWMYDHYTTGESDEGRYALMTWLNESTPLVQAEAVRLAPMRADGPFEETAAPDVCVFHLPEELRENWWTRSAPELLSGSSSHPRFDSFIGDFKRYAKLRGLGSLENMDFNVMVRPPGEVLDDENKNFSCLVNLGDKLIQITVDKSPVLLESGDGCWVPSSRSLKPHSQVVGDEPEVLLTIGSSS